MTIEERLEKVEMELARAKRWNRALLLLTTLAIMVLIAGASRRENVIRASGFIVQNERGQIIAELGKMGLRLYDFRNNCRASLDMPKDDPILTFFDENGKTRVFLGMFEKWQGLRMRDENGKSRAEIFIKGVNTEFLLWDENSKVLWSAPPSK